MASSPGFRVASNIVRNMNGVIYAVAECNTLGKVCTGKIAAAGCCKAAFDVTAAGCCTAVFAVAAHTADEVS